MIILAIETSCDDTGIALLKVKNQQFEILENFVSSQVELHAKYGGVYPSLAKREHQKNLPILFEKVSRKKIDLIAITVGPGLEPCLWVGVNFANELIKKLKVPLVPVNHIEAHILINLIDQKVKANLFPAIALIVSGGHTQIILVKNVGKYQIIGETRDDAAGECFDKVARILGLGYPGGPIISKEASKFKIQSPRFKVSLPRPMIYQKNYDFSFSGLKTAVLYDYKSRPLKVRKSKEYVQTVTAEVQQAIIDVLLLKTTKATKDYKVKTIILGGGVAANNELRKQFGNQSSKLGIKFLAPKKELTTDNALMIAVAGYYQYLKKKYDWKVVKANANLRVDEKI